MRRRLGTLVIALMAACDSASEATPASPPDARAEAADAMCKEHGVLEAVCTKCNPALASVFKAKGDWCEEHGFPESFCPICHPERGGKPSGDVRDDGAPLDGTKVTFKTKETARLAGIETVKAEQRSGRVERIMPARIVYDATKVAQINARAAGVVRAIRADIGAAVASGAALALIESADVGAEQSRVQSTRSRVQVAEANSKRLETLHAEGIVAQKEALVARQELEAARAELAAAQSALNMVSRVSGAASHYTLTAPIAGVVTQRNATIGRLVQTDAVLFEVVDTSTMWAEVDIPETDVPRVSVGQPVTLSIDGLDDRRFSGTLDYIPPIIDADTRTARGRVALTNADGLLRGNMFARASLVTTTSATAVVVPRKAVQRAKDVHLVFVRLGEDAFEARRVQLGSGDGELVEVRGRLQAGDDVVSDGSFLLKTETLKGSIGAGCCDAEEPK